MTRIFLSYARENAGTAKALAKVLEARGNHVWWDQQISGGRRFAADIERALNECEAVVVLWSDAARKSAWVQDEAAIGRDSGRLIPVSLDSEPAPIGFRQLQAIDFAGAKRSALARVADAIVSAIARLSDEPRTDEALPHQVPGSGLFTRLPRKSSIIAGISAALLLVAGVGYYSTRTDSEPPSVRVARGDGSDPGLSAEVMRNLTNDLQRLQQARSDRFRLLGNDSGPSADLEIEVAGNRAAEQLQVDVSLRRNPEILWSDSLEIPAGRRGDLRQQVVAKVGALLNCALDAQTPDGERADAATLKLFLRACDAVNFDRSTGAPDRVVATLEQVVRHNPDLPAAWALLAHARMFTARGEAAARSANARARTLDPKSPLTFVTEQMLLPPGSWDRALAIADKATAAAPTDSSVHVLRSGVLASVGRTAEAIDEARLAVRLDPISLDHRLTYALLLGAGGRVDQAAQELEEAERIWPGASSLRQTQFDFHVRYGDPKIATRILDEVGWTEIQPFSPFMEGEAAQRAYLAARVNPTPANVNAAVDAYRSARADEGFRRAAQLQALVTFGRIGEALPLLKAPGVVEQWKRGTDFLFRARMKPLWQRRQFFEFTAKMGLVGVWRATRKWPDFCRDPKLPYDCQREADRIRSRAA